MNFDPLPPLHAAAKLVIPAVGPSAAYMQLVCQICTNDTAQTVSVLMANLKNLTVLIQDASKD